MCMSSTYVCAHSHESESARRMHFGVRVRAHLRVSARACVRERCERRRNTTARPLDVIHHVGMCMSECMNVHMCVRVDSMQGCVRVRTCVRARGGSGTCARP